MTVRQKCKKKLKTQSSQIQLLAQVNDTPSKIPEEFQNAAIVAIIPELWIIALYHFNKLKSYLKSMTQTVSQPILTS